ncbi:MAG: (2Fe-2S)-binding protein [Alphaproteobacteria bacterium HGW-Alphaproteobacteria-2]|nr:MAG: (2Fe-2S)-binding protein [Alphaproteobacteria bacterium HGW-Alphaproteobacteria-2]
MPRVIFVTPDGTRTEVEGVAGDSVMATAIAHDIVGIVAECGGSMMCATCHCYVEDAWSARIGQRSDGEEEMLESAACEVRDTSRLSCQITLSSDLDGLVVHLPDAQT